MAVIHRGRARGRESRSIAGHPAPQVLKDHADLGGRPAVLDPGDPALRHADVSGQLSLRPVALAALGADRHADDLGTADEQRSHGRIAGRGQARAIPLVNTSGLSLFGSCNDQGSTTDRTRSLARYPNPKKSRVRAVDHCRCELRSSGEGARTGCGVRLEVEVVVVSKAMESAISPYRYSMHPSGHPLIGVRPSG